MSDPPSSAWDNVPRIIAIAFALAVAALMLMAVMSVQIRDAETGTIAVNASLTGHFVFSTLHTNDAPGAVSRLIDMGIKPFLVAAATRCVLAWRIKPHCRVFWGIGWKGTCRCFAIASMTQWWNIE